MSRPLYVVANTWQFDQWWRRFAQPGGPRPKHVRDVKDLYGVGHAFVIFVGSWYLTAWGWRTWEFVEARKETCDLLVTDASEASPEELIRGAAMALESPGPARP